MNGRGAEWRHLRQASDDEAAIVRRFRCVRGDSALEPEEGFSRFAERAGYQYREKRRQCDFN